MRKSKTGARKMRNPISKFRLRTHAIVTEHRSPDQQGKS